MDNEDKLALEEVTIDEILEMQREEHLQKQEEEERKRKALQERGLSYQPDPIQEDFF